MGAGNALAEKAGVTKPGESTSPIHPTGKCHGEGPVHYRVKTALCWAINHALEMPKECRNAHCHIDYYCPDPEYGPKDMMKFAPGSSGINLEFEQMRHGYHQYDLLHDSNGPRFDDSATLDRAECELWLDGLSVPPTLSAVHIARCIIKPRNMVSRRLPDLCRLPCL